MASTTQVRAPYADLALHRRHEPLARLKQQGAKAKNPYSIPVHLRQAAAKPRYEAGDPPVSETAARCIITLPIHQHLKSDEVDYTIQCVRQF